MAQLDKGGFILQRYDVGDPHNPNDPNDPASWKTAGYVYADYMDLAHRMLEHWLVVLQPGAGEIEWASPDSGQNGYTRLMPDPDHDPTSQDFQDWRNRHFSRYDAAELMYYRCDCEVYPTKGPIPL